MCYLRLPRREPEAGILGPAICKARAFRKHLGSSMRGGRGRRRRRGRMWPPEKPASAGPREGAASESHTGWRGGFCDRLVVLQQRGPAAGLRPPGPSERGPPDDEVAGRAARCDTQRVLGDRRGDLHRLPRCRSPRHVAGRA